MLSGRDFNYRIPPAWSPENENVYSFRAYMIDMSLWILLTDLQPHQQCTAIIMRVGGAAREMVRMMTPQEMTFGGVRNDVAVDPVTLLLSGLQSRSAALEKESRLTSMTEMLGFSRRPNEGISALLARSETARQLAVAEGQFIMSMEGCALQLLRVSGVQTRHLFALLQPYGGRLPQTDEPFQDICAQLRRHGRISAGAQGNVASVLNAPVRSARPGTYLACQQDLPACQQAAQRTANRPGTPNFMSTFFGSAQQSQQA